MSRSSVSEPKWLPRIGVFPVFVDDPWAPDGSPHTRGRVLILSWGGLLVQLTLARLAPQPEGQSQ